MGPEEDTKRAYESGDARERSTGFWKADSRLMIGASLTATAQKESLRMRESLARAGATP